jgi:hypothetical protein
MIRGIEMVYINKNIVIHISESITLKNKNGA